jgi:hypothetical protein
MLGERNAALMGKRALFQSAIGRIRGGEGAMFGILPNVAKPQNPFTEGNEENEDSDLVLKPIWLC